MLLIGLSSGLLYAVLHHTQRLIFLNGLEVAVVAGVITRGNPADRGSLLLQLATYLGATLALFGLFGQLWRLCERGELQGRRARLVALSFPVLFHLTFLYAYPSFSTDPYSYVAYGYIGGLPGGNPYLQEATTIATTPFGAELASLGWSGQGLSPYGPVWNQLEAVIVRVTQDVRLALLLTKAIVVAASLGSAGLIFFILNRVHPGYRLLGTLAYLWNPMLIVLLAGEGHNDALMLLFVLAALALSVCQKTATAVFLLVMGVLTKYLPLVFLPVQAVYFWRTQPRGPQLVRRFGLGLLVGLGLALVLYLPTWSGADTLTGVGGVGGESSAEGGAVDALGSLGRLGRAAVVGVVMLIMTWRARDAESLLDCCALVAVVVVLVGPQRYLPWYAATPVALMTLSPRGIFRRTLLVLSLCSLLESPVSVILSNGFVTAPVHTWTLRAARWLPLLSLVRPWRWVTPR